MAGDVMRLAGDPIRDGRPAPRDVAPTNPRPSVAAAVVTYNHRDAVVALLEFLDARGIATFVTENDCSDGTREAIRGRFRHVSMLESPANLGGCGGFNCAVLAALSAGTDYILLIDDDALPVGDCVERLAAFLDEHDAYVFAAPAVYISSKPGVLQEAGGSVDFSCENPVEAWHRFEVEPELPPHFDIDYASACCLMVRSDAVMRLGVFDWNYFIFSDDVDWSLRLRRAFGRRAACVSTAKVSHDFPWAKPFSPMRLYFFQRNGLYMQSRLREGVESAGVLHRSVRRLARFATYSRLIGDREMARTSWAALRDAHEGRLGAWREPVTFPAERERLDAAWFRANGIRRVLVDITIEDVDADIVRVIRELGGNDVVIDVLCDAHRVSTYREKRLFADVLGRSTRLSGRLGDFRHVRRRRYDLTVTDAAMEPRRPSSTAGRRAALYHAGALYDAGALGVWSCVAWMLAPILAVPIARRLGPRFLVPPPPGAPPPEAGPVLERIGVQPAIGQPWARDWPVPFPSPRAGDAAVLRLPAPHVDPREPGWTPLHRDVAPEADDEYAAWRAARRRVAAAREGASVAGPRFSIVVWGAGRAADRVAACLDAVRAQTYAGWQVILIADGNGAAPAVDVTPLSAVPGEPEHETWNRAAGLATGEYLLLVDGDDLLDRAALGMLAEASRGGQAAVVYADEDRVDACGRLHEPDFKPAFSPARLAAANYLGRPVALRRALWERLGGMGAAGEHDLLLRAVALEPDVVHVPDVLHHRRDVGAAAPPLAVTAPAGGTRRDAASSVSVLVLRDDDTGDDDLRARWSGCECLLDARDDTPPAARLNALARRATGDVVLVVSSALRPVAGWREPLLRRAAEPGIGLVGGTVRYHDGRLHSAGLVLGLAGAVGRWQHGRPAGDAGYGGWIDLPHEVSAVTRHFLALRRALLLEQGGFDDAFGDRGFAVDLALRLATRLGLRHLHEPGTGGVFGASMVEEALEAWSLDDLVALWERWGRVIRRGDPYLNPNLSLLGEDVRLVTRAESGLRERGALVAWDRCTAERLARRFPGRLRAVAGQVEAVRMAGDRPAAGALGS